jgi:hypothetical protein
VKPFFQLSYTWAFESDCKKFFILALAISGNDSNILKFIDELMSKEKSKMPLNGEDLIKIGIKGAKIGVYLERAKKEWALHNFTLNKLDLMKLVLGEGNSEPLL